MSETNAEYHLDLSRLSNSMLGDLQKCPQLFDAWYVSRTQQKPEPTDAMALGSLVHCITLEIENFNSQFVIAPDYHLDADNATKNGKRSNSKATTYYESKMEALTKAAADSGLTIVSREDYEHAELCANALLRHDQLGVLFRGNGIVETQIDFVFDGLDFRCKPDFVLPSAGLVIDVKTTRDASPEGFAKSVAAFAYHRQAALYLDAVAAKYGKDFRFLFAVVCTEAPFEVACYELEPEAIEAGLNDAYALTREYKQRKETNNWLPVWSRGVVSLGLPKYHRSKVFELDEVVA